jgi:protein tyrosine/serine phosphatase
MEIRPFTFASLIVFLLTTAVFAATEPDIQNFHEVSPGIYRGGRPAEADFGSLAAFGIRIDVDLQGGDDYPIIDWYEKGEGPAAIKNEQSDARSVGIVFLNYPLSSLHDPNKAQIHDIDQVLQMMHDPARRPIFVHCRHGVDRTGLIVALYRIRFEGWTQDQAWEEWVSLGHKRINQGVTHDLDEYFNLMAPKYAACVKLRNCDQVVTSDY